MAFKLRIASISLALCRAALSSIHRHHSIQLCTCEAHLPAAARASEALAVGHEQLALLVPFALLDLHVVSTPPTHILVTPFFAVMDDARKLQ